MALPAYRPGRLGHKYWLHDLGCEPLPDEGEYFVLRLDAGGENREHHKASLEAAIAYAKSMSSSGGRGSVPQDLLDRCEPRLRRIQQSAVVSSPRRSVAPAPEAATHTDAGYWMPVDASETPTCIRWYMKFRHHYHSPNWDYVKGLHGEGVGHPSGPFFIHSSWKPWFGVLDDSYMPALCLDYVTQHGDGVEVRVNSGRWVAVSAVTTVGQLLGNCLQVRVPRTQAWEDLNVASLMQEPINRFTF